MNLTRKEFLALTGMSVAGLVDAGWAAKKATAADGLQQRAAQLLQQYDQQGIHRTGTAVDLKSAHWLAAQVRGCGIQPTLESFPLSRVDPQACYLQIGTRRLTGLPLFDGTFTDVRGIRGRLGTPEIGLLEAPPNAEYGVGYKKMRQGAQGALVIVTKGSRPGLCPINAANFTAPYGCPVLQVSSEESEWLQAGKNAEAVLVAQVKRTEVRAFNVTARIAGTNASLAPLVVMTPRSGWWQSVSERGGGLFIWLEIMRAVAASRPARTVVFIASSGHELGHLGLHHFLEKHQSLIKGARVWIHLGANIGAAIEPAHRMQTSSDEFEKLMLNALAAAGTKVDEIAPRTNEIFGEAGNIYRGGGQYLSLLGRNGLFHHPHDRWPQAVKVSAVTSYAAAFVQIARKLAQD